MWRMRQLRRLQIVNARDPITCPPMAGAVQENTKKEPINFGSFLVNAIM